METLKHLFIDCIFATQIWMGIGLLFGRNIEVANNINKLITWAAGQRFSPQIWELWQTAWVNGVWLLWNVRNKCFFEDVQPNIHHNLRHLWALIREANALGKGHVWNSTVELNILSNLNLTPRLLRASRIISVICRRPPMGCLKVKADASVITSTSEAGYGGVFRDAHGRFIGGFSF